MRIISKSCELPFNDLYGVDHRLILLGYNSVSVSAPACDILAECVYDLYTLGDLTEGRVLSIEEGGVLMDDEELARFLTQITDDAQLDAKTKCNYQWEYWLKEEVSD